MGKKIYCCMDLLYFQEQLKVQSGNGFWRAAGGTEICAHTHKPLFLPTPQPPLTTIPVHQNKILAQTK